MKKPYKTLIEMYNEKRQQNQLDFLPRNKQLQRNAKETLKLNKVLSQGKLLPDIQLITHQQYERMRNNAVFRSKEDQLKQKKLAMQQRQKQLQAAKAKKQKMIAIQEQNKKKKQLSQLQEEEEQKKRLINQRAQKLTRQQMDLVKKMNQKIDYAKTVTIRDRQLLTKNCSKDSLKNQEKRKDLIMESERLKIIKFYQEQQQRRRQQIIRGRQVIIEQIKERDQVRLKMRQQQEKQGQQILKKISQLNKEQAEAALQKKKMQSRLNQQILQENKKAILLKQIKIQEEIAEDEKIVKYNQQKAKIQAEYQAEQKRLKDQKQKEVQRLREMQQKANDRQAQLDALRAKRAYQQNERINRQKELKEAEQKSKRAEQLTQARQLQQEQKNKKMQEQARHELQEFKRILQKHKEQIQIEHKLNQQRQNLIKKHGHQLKKQISLNQQKKRIDTKMYLEEGRKIKQSLDGNNTLLEQIKEQKLQQLRRLGIPQKYRVQLQKIRVDK